MFETALEAWRYTYRDIFEAAFIEDFVRANYSPEQLKTMTPFLLEGRHYFGIAEAAGSRQIIGYCHLRLRDQPTAELARIYLRPAHMGLGIGAQMLARGEVFLESHHVSSYYCYVHSRNEPGKRFYLKQNFVHQPAQDKDDEWYMVKHLAR